MFPVTTNFKNKADDPQAVPQKHFEFPAGLGGGAARFNGTTGYVTMGNPASLDFGSGDCSYEVWAEYRTTLNPGDRQPYLAKGTAFNTGAYGVQICDTSAIAYTPSGNFNDGTWNSLLVLNSWNYFVITRSGNTWKIYLNGSQVSTQTLSGSTSDGSGNGILVLGRRGAGNDNYVNGREAHAAVYNYALTPTKIAAHYAARNNKAGFYRAAIMADNPISYWRLGETSGTVAADEMGANTGTYAGGVTLGVDGPVSTDYSDRLLNMGSFNQLQYEGDDLTGADLTVECLNDSKEFNFLKTDKTNIGKIGTLNLGFPNGAAQFDGSTGYVECAVTQIPAVVSVEAWIKAPNNGGIEKGILSNRNGGVGITTFSVAGNLLYIWDDTSGYFTGSTVVLDGKKHYIVYVLTGTTATTYVDGVLDATGAYSRVSSTGILRIADDAANPGARFFIAGGMIDEVAHYAAALSPAQIAAHYAAATNKSSSYRAAVMADNPVSYWRLGEASGTVAADEMGVNPGTYIGGVTLGVAGALDDGHDGEMITRYSGYLDEVEFITEERAKVRMKFVSRAKRAIERSLGSDAFPLDYTGTAYNPADLVWELLTNRAGLDATASTANVDIDYTSWLEYKTTCDSLQFSFKAFFTGQTISEALRLIGELTDALIYGDTDGKFYFKKFFPHENAYYSGLSYYSFTEANAHLQAANMIINKSRIINKAKVWYGYDPIGLVWAGSVTYQNSTSQTNYSLLGREFDNAGIWHETVVSAEAFGERLVARYQDPAEQVKFGTKLGTQAMIHQIGDDMKMTWGQVDYADKQMRIYGLGGDLTPGIYEIDAEEISLRELDYFILDSSSNGVLDQNILA
jgi:hypothetical protein